MNNPSNINPNDPRLKVVGIEIERNSLWGIVAGSIIARDAYTKEVLSGKSTIRPDLVDSPVKDQNGKQLTRPDGKLATQPQYAGENFFVLAGREKRIHRY